MASHSTTSLDLLRADPSLAALGLVVTDVLGEGGSSIVYRARDDRHGRDVAVKVVRHAPEIERAAERFSQEIRVAGRLRHPHILPLFDSGTLEDGRRFFVMPVAQGRTLRELIDEGPLAVDLAVRIAREIAEALAHLHRCGFVHRDVKPENVLVEAGHAVLTDFGLAAPMHSRQQPVSDAEHDAWWTSTASHRRFTAMGSIVGTPHYMSPEALFADAPLDGLIDIYALGVVLFEMLTGTLPFGSASPEQIIAHVMREAMPRVSERRTDVPVALDDVIARATARNPDDRYTTADEMAEALTALGIGLNVSDNRASMFTRRRSISVAVLLLAMAGAGATWAMTHGEKLDPRRIVVADLANDTGDSSLTGVGVLAGDIIAAGLTTDRALTIVNATVALPSHLQVHLPSADSTLTRETRELVEATHAGVAVTGAYFRIGRDLQVVAEVTDTRTDRVLGVAGPVRATRERPDSSLRVLRDSVVAIVTRLR